MRNVVLSDNDHQLIVKMLKDRKHDLRTPVWRRAIGADKCIVETAEIDHALTSLEGE